MKGPLARKLVSTALIALSILNAQRASGWGNEGHVYVNRVAAERIPLEMPRFLRRAVAELAYLGPEPDRWRSPSEYTLKNAQEPDHFIDLERIAWLDPLPQGRYDFYRKLYEKRAAAKENPDDYLPEHVGLQPFIVIEIFGRLKAAFREYRHMRQLHQPTRSGRTRNRVLCGLARPLRRRRFPTTNRPHATRSRDARKSAGEHQRFSLAQLRTSSIMRPKELRWHVVPIPGSDGAIRKYSRLP